jgi:hypothetical protein
MASWSDQMPTAFDSVHEPPLLRRIIASYI